MVLIQTLKRHSLLTYFALAFGLTWACWIPLALSDAFASEYTAQPSSLLLLWPVGLIMPSLAGILLTALFSGKSGLGALFRRLGQVRVAPTWYAVVLLLVPVLLFVAIVVNTWLGGATIDYAYAWSNLLVWLVLCLIPGLGEELGWRGFALPRLQAHHQALPASLFLGVMWGLWHLPLLIANSLVPLTSLGLVNFLLYDVTITALAVLFTWVYNNTNGNLLLLVLFHAVADATTGLFLLSFNDVIAPFLPKYGAPLLFLLLLWVVVMLVTLVTGPARLSRNEAPVSSQAG
jgi:membrane protease YdiL (CAAX protease family)